MARSRLAALLVCLLWPVPMPGFAQPAAAGPAPSAAGRVERPDVKVGESWRYQVTDTFTNLAQAVSVEVTAVTEDRIHTRSSRPSAGGVIEIWDRNWNQIKQGEMDYTPYYPALQFPLEPGKQWSGSVQYKTTSGVTNQKLTAQVAGWERVAVPAGSFDAVRINLRGDFAESLSLNYYAPHGSVSDVIWYAPAVRRIVKRELTHRDLSQNRAGALAERWELLEYRPN